MVIDLTDPRWWTALVAVAALVQPWVIKGWNKWLRKGSVRVYPAGNIVVGYGPPGPTLFLHGTLRAIHRDQFVAALQVTVIRLSDGARHEFDWWTFQSGPLRMFGGLSEANFEVPVGFLLSAAQPYRYSIVFLDRSIGNQVEQVISSVRDEWNQQLTSTVSPMLLAANVDPSQVQSLVSNLHQQFSSTMQYAEQLSELDRACYWEAGLYEIELRVKTTDPDVVFPTRWRFQLTDSASRSLRLNARSILREATGQPLLIPYTWAPTPYLPQDRTAP